VRPNGAKRYLAGASGVKKTALISRHRRQLRYIGRSLSLGDWWPGRHDRIEPREGPQTCPRPRCGVSLRMSASAGPQSFFRCAIPPLRIYPGTLRFVPDHQILPRIELTATCDQACKAIHISTGPAM